MRVRRQPDVPAQVRRHVRRSTLNRDLASICELESMKPWIEEIGPRMPALVNADLILTHQGLVSPVADLELTHLLLGFPVAELKLTPPGYWPAILSADGDHAVPGHSTGLRAG